MKSINVLIIVLLMCGCSNVSEYDFILRENLVWKPSMVRGARFKLDDRRIIENYDFSVDDRYVATTLGEKGFWTTSPLYRWRIDFEGRLIIEDSNRKRFRRFTLHKYTNGRLIATDGNQIFIFKRHKLAEQGAASDR